MPPTTDTGATTTSAGGARGGPVGSKAARAERSTEAMLDAAVALIAEGGLASMTFAAISERSGYSRGLVTARFGSKDGLVEALIRRVWGELHDLGVVPLTTDGSGLDSLLALLDGIRDVTRDASQDARALYALLFESLGQDAALRARMARFHDAMRTDIAEALRRGRDDGSVRDDVDPVRGAALVVAAMEGVAFGWMLDPDPAAATTAYDDLRDHVRSRFGAS
ncbi:MAG: TetR/AcrR family transcriptional regulator [Actinomycetota bacterium]|nr:TetR/AcrR family transcriptional regulator [Actinomycetota bacterium]